MIVAFLALGSTQTLSRSNNSVPASRTRLKPNRWAAVTRTAVSFMALLYTALAHECRAGPIERIERGLIAGGAGCGSFQRCLKPNTYEGPLCWV